MNNSFLYLSEKDIHGLIDNDLPLVLNSIRDAILFEYEGKSLQPEKISVTFDDDYQNRINCMPAAIDNTYGAKWVSVFPSNKRAGIRTVEGYTLISELETGTLTCLLNATQCTSFRTAAVGALAAKVLAPRIVERVGFIGAGEEAKAHFLMLKHLYPQLKQCCFASRTESRISETILQLEVNAGNTELVNCGSNYEAAVSGADIVVTAISSQAPVLKAKWVKKGALYIHVAGFEDEFEVAKVADKIVCDNWECVKHRNQTLALMYRKGLLTDDDIYGDLAEILTDKKKARENDNEFIYFNSVGMASEDILLARRIYKKALNQGVGTWIKK